MKNIVSYIDFRISNRINESTDKLVNQLTYAEATDFIYNKERITINQRDIKYIRELINEINIDFQGGDEDQIHLTKNNIHYSLQKVEGEWWLIYESSISTKTKYYIVDSLEGIKEFLEAIK
jgi:hypothetical protein